MSNARFTITQARAAMDMRLSDTEHRTLCILGMYGDKDGWCWPSQASMAKKREISQQAISKHIKKLVELNYLEVFPQYDDVTGARKSNLYRIRFDSPINTPPTTSEVVGDTTSDVVTPTTLKGCNNDTVNDTLNDLKISNEHSIEDISGETPIEDEDPRQAYQARLEYVRRKNTLTAMSKGHENHQGITTLFFDLFHVNVNWSTKRGRDFALWLKERPPDQTLRRFSDWWYSTDWRGQKGQPPSIEQVMTMWPQAFYEQEAHRSAINIPAEVY